MIVQPGSLSMNYVVPTREVDDGEDEQTSTLSGPARKKKAKKKSKKSKAKKGKSKSKKSKAKKKKKR